jgi:glycine oxidase
MKQVIVVGAGVVGLFCAVRLAKAGARVTVLEAEGEHASVHGPGASAAAAGLLAPVHDERSAHDGAGLESFRLWMRLREGAEWADGVRFDGGVIVRDTPEEAADLQRRAEQIGCQAAPLSAGQFRKRTGLHARIGNAVFVAEEGVADPLRVLSGLAMQARAHGVIIDYRRDVANVTASAVKTHDDAVYEADAVVLAPGAWATEKLMEAAPALRLVQPMKGHAAAVALERPLGPNLRAPDFYLAQRREDVVLGATAEPGVYDRSVDRRRVGELAAAAEALLPGEVKLLDRAWAGIRPMSPDGWPMVGPTGDGLHVAAGHSRNGWLMAPITAEMISAYVFGAEIPPEWAALSPARFGPS